MPEITLRSALHRTGLRYRLHDDRLPGTPDLVFPRYKAIVFVHGCFWHAHGCSRSTIPKSRQDFWLKKFRTNRERDRRNVTQLRGMGWRVLTVWECLLNGKSAMPSDAVAARVRAWLAGDSAQGEFPKSSIGE